MRSSSSAITQPLMPPQPLFRPLNEHSFPYTSCLFPQCPPTTAVLSSPGSSLPLTPPSSLPPTHLHFTGDGLAHFNPSRCWAGDACLAFFFFFFKNSNQLSLLSGGALCGAHASRSGVAVAPRASPEARPQRWSSGPGVGGDGSRRWRGICRLPQSEPPPLRPRLSPPRLFSAPTASVERAPLPPQC